jgi:phage baseplate assembly protein W
VPDLLHQFGSDLATSPAGDLATVDVPLLTVQRVLRRLLTNPGAYIWHPGYGAGLPRFVGRTINVAAIIGVVRGQLFQEAGVARTPEPSIEVAADTGGSVFLTIQYVDAATQKPSVLGFSVDATGASNITIG